jgi:hypothetical protein
LGYFMTIWYSLYSLGTFFRFRYHVSRKIWQPCYWVLIRKALSRFFKVSFFVHQAVSSSHFQPQKVAVSRNGIIRANANKLKNNVHKLEEKCWIYCCCFS